MYIRYLLRFFDCLAHPNLSATFATDEKWPLCHLPISYQSLAGSLSSLRKSELLKLIFFILSLFLLSKLKSVAQNEWKNTHIHSFLAPPLWRNSGGRRWFRVTIGRLVVGSIPGRDLRERNFGGAQNHIKEWWEWDDNACTLTIGAWHNSLDRRPPWYLVSPLLKTNKTN